VTRTSFSSNTVRKTSKLEREIHMRPEKEFTDILFLKLKHFPKIILRFLVSRDSKKKVLLKK
jgi:hypothetical protein